MPSRLPAPHSLSSLPLSAQHTVLSTLFEPSPTLAALVLPFSLSAAPPSQPIPATPGVEPSRPSSGQASWVPEQYDALIEAVRARLLALRATGLPGALAALDEILGAHPRLGAARPATTATS